MEIHLRRDQSTDLRHPLPKWLAANVDTARANLAKHEPYRLQTQRLQVDRISTFKQSC